MSLHDHKPPPGSPELLAHGQTLSSVHVQLFVDLLKAAQAIQTTSAAVEPTQPLNTEQIFIYSLYNNIILP